MGIGSRRKLVVRHRSKSRSFSGSRGGDALNSDPGPRINGSNAHANGMMNQNAGNLNNHSSDEVQMVTSPVPGAIGDDALPMIRERKQRQQSKSGPRKPHRASVGNPRNMRRTTMERGKTTLSVCFPSVVRKVVWLMSLTVLMLLCNPFLFYQCIAAVANSDGLVGIMRPSASHRAVPEIRLPVFSSSQGSLNGQIHTQHNLRSPNGSSSATLGSVEGKHNSLLRNSGRFEGQFLCVFSTLCFTS